MLTDFFFLLRANRVPVTVTEWMTFIEALGKGLAEESLGRLYTLARSLLVKDVTHYDTYDRVFAHFFRDVELAPRIKEELEDWLSQPIDFLNLSPEEREMLEKWDFDKLQEEFEKRLQEQTERHDGGNRWIGTGGTSPFGHGGYNPQGIRVGGQGGNRTAIQVATLRRFANYRSDRVLDLRQMKVALKKLKVLERVGAADELDLDASIDKTCRDGGEIDLVFRPERRNRFKLLLLMDAGGSMDPYAELVSRMFSAASQMSHFKDFKYYYFHNCVYEEVFTDMELDERVATGKLLADLESDWRVVFVGDAAMSPYELAAKYGAIYYYHRNEQPGIWWLKRFSQHFRKVVWLNPMPERFWMNQSIQMIRKLFPMYSLTIDGLEEAVDTLR